MTKTQDQTLSGDVQIDGGHFVNVVFKNAQLLYDGGKAPTFENCTFDNSRFTFRESAGNTLIFLRAMASGSNMRQIVHGLMPEMPR